MLRLTLFFWAFAFIACGPIEIPNPIIDAGLGGSGGSAGFGGAEGSGGSGAEPYPLGDCMHFDAYPGLGAACAVDADCMASTNPCAPAACMSGQCVQLDPGEGQPGACKDGWFCRYLDKAGPPYGCCRYPPKCIYDPGNNCQVSGQCPYFAGLTCNADGFCCH